MLNEKRAGWKPSFGLPRPGRHQHFLNHNTSLTVLARVTLPHFRARPDFPDVAPLAHLIVGTNLDRVLWGEQLAASGTRSEPDGHRAALPE